MKLPRSTSVSSPPVSGSPSCCGIYTPPMATNLLIDFPRTHLGSHNGPSTHPGVHAQALREIADGCAIFNRRRAQSSNVQLFLERIRLLSKNRLPEVSSGNNKSHSHRQVSDSRVFACLILNHGLGNFLPGVGNSAVPLSCSK
jgi:hypothetical protein